MVLAGKILQKKRTNLYWTPCAAHCIDLMLEDIGKMPEMKATLKKVMSVTAYVYVRPGVVHMMRTFTKKMELCRAGVTRFATAFFTLQRMLKLKDGLKNMFTSEEWAQSKWSNEVDGKKVTAIILSPRFWRSVTHILKIYAPLVRVLRLVDGEKKPAMGYIYEAMDRAKEAIMDAFSKNEEHYKKAFAIIDERWEDQLHKPLHAAGYFLNPEFFYKSDHVDKEVSKGFYAVMMKLLPESSEQDKISAELDAYRNAAGEFGLPLAVRQRAAVAPAVWWANFGADAPTLQKLAIKVLSLTCSSSGSERNWSIFENVHAKRRNRLEQQRLNDLVFIKYNRALKRRYDSRDHIDPISLRDIDESNEWVVGLMEDEDELVHQGENLTWGIATEAMGVDEPTYDTRSKGKKVAPKGPNQVEKSKEPKGKGKGKNKGKGVGVGVSVRGSSFSGPRDEDENEDEIEFNLEGEDVEEEEFREDDPRYDDGEEEEEEEEEFAFDEFVDGDD